MLLCLLTNFKCPQCTLLLASIKNIWMHPQIGEPLPLSELDGPRDLCQVEIAAADPDKSAITSHAEIHWPASAQIWLHCTPDTFKRAADEILSSVKWLFALKHLCYTVAFSRDAEEINAVFRTKNHFFQIWRYAEYQQMMFQKRAILSKACNRTRQSGLSLSKVPTHWQVENFNEPNQAKFTPQVVEFTAAVCLQPCPPSKSSWKNPWKRLH